MIFNRICSHVQKCLWSYESNLRLSPLCCNMSVWVFLEFQNGVLVGKRPIIAPTTRHCFHYDLIWLSTGSGPPRCNWKTGSLLEAQESLRWPSQVSGGFLKIFKRYFQCFSVTFPGSESLMDTGNRSHCGLNYLWVSVSIRGLGMDPLKLPRSSCILFRSSKDDSAKRNIKTSSYIGWSWSFTQCLLFQPPSLRTFCFYTYLWPLWQNILQLSWTALLFLTKHSIVGVINIVDGH